MSEPIRVLVIEQLVRWHIPFCAVLEMDQPIILVLLDINPRMVFWTSLPLLKDATATDKEVSFNDLNMTVLVGSRQEEKA